MGTVTWKAEHRCDMSSDTANDDERDRERQRHRLIFFHELYNFNTHPFQKHGHS
jgi:hypothetical protein